MKWTPKHDYIALAILAAALLCVLLLTGCWGRETTPEDAAKVGGAIGAVIGGPWGAVVGSTVAAAIALAARKFERGRMVAQHADTVRTLTQTISALQTTQATTPAAKYSPNDQNPVNGDGLVPHGS